MLEVYIGYVAYGLVWADYKLGWVMYRLGWGPTDRAGRPTGQTGEAWQSNNLNGLGQAELGSEAGFGREKTGL